MFHIVFLTLTANKCNNVACCNNVGCIIVCWHDRLGANGKSLVIETKLVIAMKSNNVIAPYEFKRVNFLLLSAAICMHL